VRFTRVARSAKGNGTARGTLEPDVGTWRRDGNVSSDERLDIRYTE